MLDVSLPLRQATDCVQRQTAVAASYSIPYVRGVRTNLTDTATRYNAKLIYFIEDITT